MYLRRGLIGRLLDAIYRKSETSALISVRKPIATTITLEVRGSDDDFATDRRDFSTEEEIRINGDVIAADGADLTAGKVEVYLNGTYLGDAALTYDPATMTNFYMFSLGFLAEADYTITVRFPRLKI